ncbi:MAG: metallophosphoesterase, partial [Bdellovibrionales bacterium]|nr:metallophosphoesterase [Bdellovibrionales bacterium]
MRTLLIITTFFSSLCFAESFLTILHTNDSHGNYYGNPNKILNRTEYGFVERYKLIQKIRSVSKHTLLLSGGDINTGTPESDQFEAEPDFKAMEIMGYDAMVLGNHEFDNPPAILSKQKSWVNFPFLAANIRPISGQAPFTPYLVKEFEGKRILIVGLLTDEISKTSYKGFPTKNPIYSMENEVQWAEQELP